MDDLDDELAGELGRLVVRLDRSIQAVEGIGRVHVNRWGDGASHFHMWLYARPLGSSQMLGFCLPLWEPIVARTPPEAWQRNLAVVAGELAKGGGRSCQRADRRGAAPLRPMLVGGLCHRATRAATPE